MFHHHQTGPTAEEDFVRGHLFGPRPCDRIEDGQQRRGTAGGGVRPAPQLRDTGSLPAEYRLQQTPRDGQADAFGLSGAGELSLDIGSDADTKTLVGFEGAQTLAQVGELLLEVGELLLMGSGIEVTKCGVCLAVEALAADAALVCVVGDVAVSAEEDTRGAGESFAWSYDRHG